MGAAIYIQGTSLTVRLPEELDHPASDLIRKETDRIMGQTYIKTIIFDFEETTFMDSSGIGLIMGRYRALGMGKGCIKASMNVNPIPDLSLSGRVVYKGSMAFSIFSIPAPSSAISIWISCPCLLQVIWILCISPS